MRTFAYSLVFMLLLLPGCAMPSQPMQDSLETRVCGWKEPVMFWLWSQAAGRPDAQRLAGLSGLTDIAFSTGDGRTLRGYRLAARTLPRKGYLLVLQGNAILADKLIGEFRRYAESGYDVYMYDYRGYGRSEGKRRLKAIVSDVREIIDFLNKQPYPRRLVYAFSFGGIVLLDAWQDAFRLDRAVVDSAPGRLSDYGCPQAYDPVRHLPADCTHMLFISGQQDRVVTPAMVREIEVQARQCGARVVNDEEFAHPFMDANPASRQRRQSQIEAFLLEEAR